MRALQFATANLASQSAFLFLATHGPIFIASSSSATLLSTNPLSVGSSIAAQAGAAPPSPHSLCFFCVRVSFPGHPAAH